MSMKIPKSAILDIFLVTTLPTPTSSDNISHGLLVNCLIPPLIFLFSLSIAKILNSTLSPTDNLFSNLAQAKSDVWINASIPSSTSTKTP
jgi:hypothetical protein